MSNRYAAAAAALFLLLAATPAAAYVGPGAGLSLLGALWGLVVAIAVAVGFVVLWPLRRMFRKGKKQQPAKLNAPAEAPETMERREPKSQTPS